MQNTIYEGNDQDGYDSEGKANAYNVHKMKWNNYCNNELEGSTSEFQLEPSDICTSIEYHQGGTIHPQQSQTTV